MAELVTNADDVEVIIENESGNFIRVKAEEFTLTSEQDITSVSNVGQNIPRGLSKGDIEYTFSFTIEGDDTAIKQSVNDEVGDARPFGMTAGKPIEANESGAGGGDEYEWEYGFDLCLADTEEITGTTGETLGYSVEGMAAGRSREL